MEASPLKTAPSLSFLGLVVLEVSGIYLSAKQP